jgi:hypothetical protein
VVETEKKGEDERYRERREGGGKGIREKESKTGKDTGREREGEKKRE